MSESDPGKATLEPLITGGPSNSLKVPVPPGTKVSVSAILVKLNEAARAAAATITRVATHTHAAALKTLPTGVRYHAHPNSATRCCLDSSANAPRCAYDPGDRNTGKGRCDPSAFIACARPTRERPCIRRCRVPTAHDQSRVTSVAGKSEPDSDEYIPRSHSVVLSLIAPQLRARRTRINIIYLIKNRLTSA